MTDRQDIVCRWPLIARFLRVDPCGQIGHDWARWVAADGWLCPAERAEAYAEWADYFEFRLGTFDEPDAALHKQWAAEMVSACRSAAVCLRGADA